MSHAIETMVGTVSRENVITLTGGAPGPCRLHTSTEPHGDGLSPGPTDAWRALPPAGAGDTVPGPGTARPTLLPSRPQERLSRGASRDPLGPSASHHVWPDTPGEGRRQKDKEKTRDSKGKWAEERRADRNTHTEVVPVRELKKEADRRGEGKREKGAAGTEADTQTETSSGAGEAPVKRGTWPGSLEEPRVPSLVTKAVSATGHSGPARVNWEEVGTECGYWEQLRLKWKKERTGARGVPGPQRAPFLFGTPFKE